MPEVIANLSLNDDVRITKRDFTKSSELSALSIDQTSGRYVVCHPRSGDTGELGGDIIIYPGSHLQTIEDPVTYTNFGDAKSLYVPMDVKWVYIRSKIWIADMGNNRVLRIDTKTYKQDLSIGIQYPHALALDLNRGAVFAKGCSQTREGLVIYVNKEGTVVESFHFDDAFSTANGDAAMASGVLEDVPLSTCMAFDHARSRAWWVSSSMSYMVDIYNEEIRSYNLITNGFVNAKSIDVEYSTGNAFIVATDNRYNLDYVVQMFRDNNKFISSAY